MDMKRLLTGAGAVVACGAAAAGAIRLWDHFLPVWERWRYAPAEAPSAMGRAILQERAGERYRAVLREHARIQALIDAARSRGDKVDFLEPKMKNALALAERGQYGEATVLLNIIEMQAPRKAEEIAPQRLAPPPAAATRIQAAPVKSPRSAGVPSRKKRKSKQIK